MITVIENGLLTYGFRIGDYVVEKEDRLDHAMRIDRIVWSTFADVTLVARPKWKSRVYLRDLETVAARLDREERSDDD